jgi:hypothetical protein
MSDSTRRNALVTQAERAHRSRLAVELLMDISSAVEVPIGTFLESPRLSTKSIAMEIQGTFSLQRMFEQLHSASIEDRVRFFRQLGAAIRPWAGEAADYLESYEETTS